MVEYSLCVIPFTLHHICFWNIYMIGSTYGELPFRWDKGRKYQTLSLFLFVFLRTWTMFSTKSAYDKKSLCYKMHTWFSSLYLFVATEPLFIHSLNLQPHSVTRLGISAHMQMWEGAVKLRHFNKLVFED